MIQAGGTPRQVASRGFQDTWRPPVSLWACEGAGL